MVGGSSRRGGRHCHPPLHHASACTMGFNMRLARGPVAAQKFAKYAQMLESGDFKLIPFTISTFGELSSQADSFVDAAVEFIPHDNN